jgi:hypothetical protein
MRSAATAASETSSSGSRWRTAAPGRAAERDHSQAALAVGERRRHQAAQPRGDEALRGGEALVLAGVQDECRHPFLGDLVQQRARVEIVAAAGAGGARRGAVELAVAAAQHDRPVFGLQVIEHPVEDELQQLGERASGESRWTSLIATAPGAKG